MSTGTIETQAQRDAAMSWIAYWKRSIGLDQQSWLAGENARSDIMRLRRQIDDYDRRMDVAATVAPLA